MQCHAEIGKPGSYHGCKRRAVFAAREKRYEFGTLYYCRIHASRGTNPKCVSNPSNRYLVAMPKE